MTICCLNFISFDTLSFVSSSIWVFHFRMLSDACDMFLKREVFQREVSVSVGGAEEVLRSADCDFGTSELQK